MKKKNFLMLTVFLTVTFIIASITDSSTKIVQPPTAETGAPSENHCGNSSCHNTATNTGGGTLNVSFNQSTYTPDSTYIVSVSTNETGKKRFGFEATMLDASNTKAGTFSLINLANTSLQTAASTRQYAGHKSATGNKTWTFKWKAPSTNIGDVTIYVSSICADSNGLKTGDHCYTTSLVFQPNPFIAVEGISDVTDFVTVQNPVTDKMFVEFFELKLTNILSVTGFCTVTKSVTSEIPLTAINGFG